MKKSSNCTLLFAIVLGSTILSASYALGQEGGFVPPMPSLTEQSKKMMDVINARITNINTDELKNILKEHPETVLIDVRTLIELNLMGGHIDSPRHQNIIRGWLEF